MVVMTVRFRQDVAAASLAVPDSGSALVRRLLFRSHDTPARQRMLTWLVTVDDTRLLKFGLTPEDISILRTAAWVKRLTISLPLPPD
jgi:hypothetical protein